MTRSERDAALGNAIMARSLIRESYPVGRDRADLLLALDHVINTLDKHQPEDAR